MAHMTKGWLHAKDRTIDPEFGKYLRELARPSQIAYVQMMNRHQGNLSGVEFQHHRDEERWAFVIEDASETGYRIQLFDTFGVSGHQHYATLDEAVQEMLSQGYLVEDQGALDRVSQTPRWAEGIAWLDIIAAHSMRPGNGATA